MSAKRATQSTPGIVKGSNSIKVGSDGAIDVNTTFTQAVNLANIITGEAIATILGKVSKAIATTMNLNQNALLKSMLTSIDANDSSKIPTAAYIHTLVERIGMGTQLTAGANLTEAANNLSSNLANVSSTATTANNKVQLDGGPIKIIAYAGDGNWSFQQQYGDGHILSLSINDTQIAYDYYDGKNWTRKWTK